MPKYHPKDVVWGEVANFAKGGFKCRPLVILSSWEVELEKETVTDYLGSGSV